MQRRWLTLFALMVLGRIGISRGQEFVREPEIAAAPANLIQAKAEFSTELFRAKDGTTIPYRLLTPKTIVAGRRYPLILVLHGSGAIGTDNVSQLNGFAAGWATDRIRQLFPAFVLVPQSPERTANYTTSKEDGLLAADAGAALTGIVALVEQTARTQAIRMDQIYVTGFSMGASAGWQAMLIRPKLFAAAVLCSGVPPERGLAPRFVDEAILMLHGNVDPENPFAPDRAMFAALQRVPGARVRFREYDNLTHRLPHDVLAVDATGDWWREWMFTQRQTVGNGLTRP